MKRANADAIVRRGAHVAWTWLCACLLCGCGRLGYGELPAVARTGDAAAERDAGMQLPDAAVALDAHAPDAAADSCNPLATRDYCVALPALPEEPVIDGALDCGPSLTELPQKAWTGLEPLPDDEHARYAVAWRPNGLYFYIEVDDSTRVVAGVGKDPWCGDGVEIYADSDGNFPSLDNGYDNPGAIQLLAPAPAAVVPKARASDERYRAPNRVRVGVWSGRHLMVARDTGYALEAFVEAADLDLSDWSLSAGARVGIDLAIDVSVPVANANRTCEQRLGQYFLNVATDPCASESCMPYTNANAFCTPTLE